MAWTERGKALHLQVDTLDFAESLELANRIGKVAEELNHHPDLELGWGYLRIHLSSHDAGRVTERDRTLAQRIDGILEKGIN